MSYTIVAHFVNLCSKYCIIYTNLIVAHAPTTFVHTHTHTHTHTLRILYRDKCFLGKVIVAEF